MDPSSRHKRSSVILLVAAACVLLAIFLWPRGWARQPTDDVWESLRLGDMVAAQQHLDQLPDTADIEAEVEYLAAVICRRGGRLDAFDGHLERAEQLGWSKADIQRQRELLQVQSGDVGSGEAALSAIVTEGASDDIAAETYEAMAIGYLASHRFRDAWQCLEYWLRWQPEAPIAHLLRANVYERQDHLNEAVDDYRFALRQLSQHREASLGLANVLLRLSQIEAAREQFAIRLRQDPDDIDALLGVVECDRASADQTSATEHLETLLLKPNLTRQQRAKAISLQGQLALGAGDANLAVTAFRQAAALTPESVEIHYPLATALQQIGLDEEAEYHRRRASQLRAQTEQLRELMEQIVDRPDDADLRHKIGLVLIDLGRHEDGRGWLQNALRCDANHEPTKRFLEGGYYFKQGLVAAGKRDLPGLQQAAAALADLDGYRPHRQLLAGITSLQTGDLPTALEHFGEARSHRDTQVWALTLSGEALYKLKQYRDAIRVLSTAVMLNPGQTDAHRWLAASYHDIGAMDDAIAELNLVAEQAPQDPRPHRLMGLILRDFEFYDQAVDEYRRFFAKSAEHVEAAQTRIELADCLIKLRQYDGALEILNRSSPNAKVLAMRAHCHNALGNKEEATRLLAEGLTEDPNSLDILQLSASISLEQGDVDAAIESLQTAVTSDPTQWQIRYQLSQAYQRAGQEERAQEELAAMQKLREMWERFAALHKKAIKDPSDVDARVELGDVALELEQPKLAMDWFQAALGLDPTRSDASQKLQALREPSAEATP